MTAGEGWALASGLITLLAALIGGYWSVARFVVRQFQNDLSARFEAQDKARREGRQQSEDRLVRIEQNHHTLETRLLEHLAELPLNYVRREDHIRYETVINAKLDALAAKIDLANERHAAKGE